MADTLLSQLQTTKFRRGTAFSVSFPTLPSLTVQPRRADIVQKQYNHDLLFLEYSAVSPLWFDSLHTGIPIEFQWTQDSLTKYWIGYVSTISKTDAPQRQNSMEVMCVGSSFVLKERTTRVFESMTIPEVVSQIVTEFGFNYLGVQNDQRFEQLTIAGNSYWEWIQEQAKKIGYGVMVDGMNFIFKPLDKLIDMGFSSAAALSMGTQSTPFNSQFLDRTLDQFTVLSGEHIEDGVSYRAVKHVGGVDPVTAQMITGIQSPNQTGDSLRESVSDVLFSEYRTDRVVSSATMAVSAADGLAQMARFNLPATATCQGDPRIRPFAPVYVNGTGDLTDGFWVVRDAHHMFHKVGDYQMDITLATDGLGTTAETPFRTRSATAAGTVNLDEAIANNGSAINFFDTSEVELAQTIIKENTQGYIRTPNMWKSLRKAAS